MLTRHLLIGRPANIGPDFKSYPRAPVSNNRWVEAGCNVVSEYQRLTNVTFMYDFDTTIPFGDENMKSRVMLRLTPVITV